MRLAHVGDELLVVAAQLGPHIGRGDVLGLIAQNTLHPVEDV
jgi:hypothetical protein